jgi:glycopeptide antibiotics resistance protein
MVGLYSFVPFDFFARTDIGEAIRERGCLVPFKGYWASRPNDALEALSGDFLKFFALGAVLAMMLRRRTGQTWRMELAACVGIACLFSAVTETAHIFMPSRHVDITHVLMAAVGAFTGVVAYRWTIDYRATISRVFADDLLTGQLMEGATYQETQITAPRSTHGDVSPTVRTESRRPG